MNRLGICFKLVCAFVAVTLFLPAVSAQGKSPDIIVTGSVLDAHSKQPVKAAQISIPVAGTTATTDDKGEFSIKTTTLKAVLKVKAYDYNTVEMPLRGKDQVVVKLYSDRFSTFSKKTVGLLGDVENSEKTNSTRGVDDMQHVSAISVDETIQGAIGGDVRAVTRSGLSGMGAALFIRGLHSLNANSQPLFIVDGVIWDNLNDVVSIHKGFFSNPLSTIDVNDIESITVVKDGTSVYGSKASNGVVVIKTKRSSSMVTKISFNVFSGVTDIPATMPMMTADSYRIYASDLIGTQGVTGTDISNYDFLENDKSNIKVYNTNHNSTNWPKEIYQKGFTDSYLINVNGGDEKALYYFSLGYTANNGVVKTTKSDRINTRLNADIKLIETVNLGVNIGVAQATRTLLDDGMNFSSPTWISYVKSPFMAPNSYTFIGEKSTDLEHTDEFGVGNPVGVIDLSLNNLRNTRVNVGLTPTIKLSKEFTLSTQFDYNVNKTVERHYIPMNYTPIQYIPNYGLSENEVKSQVMRNTNYFDDTRLTYEKSFGHQHHVKAMYGLRYSNNYYESDYLEEHNTKMNSNTQITGDFKYLQTNGINKHTNSLSNYVNVDYDFEKRYFLTLTTAMDASSRFGSETKGGMSLFGHTWGFFPAINGAWLMSSEGFMKNLPVVSLLKLRAGFDVTGNDGIEDYQTRAYFAGVQFIGRANGLLLANLDNPTLQWETTKTAHAGVDLGVFNDRLALGFDCFSSNTSNLLLLKQAPDVSGLGNYWTNGGTLENKGFEVSVDWKVLNLKDLTWELGASVGHYANKITSLSVPDYSTPVFEGEIRTAVGLPVGAFYGYKSLGVFATQAEADVASLSNRNADGTISSPNFGAGDIHFEDVPDANGVKDGIIDEKDKQVIGNPNPDFYGNITTKIAYKQFTLSGVFTYSYGNDVYNYFRSQLEAGKEFNNQTNIMLTRWTADGQTTNQPKAMYGDPMGNSRFSSRWIEDGSYLRLKNITLSYDVPIKSDYIQGFNLWVSANNLFTLTKYLGLDPESSANNAVYYQGIDAGLLPQSRSYFVGIKFNL
ncbi:MAG TPA: SusC/RagA family TonB-linked outer membrane protein [Paludibacter sp.]|nr:SusC/RagA family TonB-linked outer membrane protein [Paludibacter sp.]